MIFLRWALLLLIAASMLAAIGTLGGEEQPAALRLAVAAAIGTLAPLFWPGPADSARGTTRRVLLWSAMSTAAAALLAALLGGLRGPAAALAATLGLLLLMLITVHAITAWLGVAFATGTAGVSAVAAVVLTGSVPLWAGPAAELLSRSHPGALDLAVDASPLTHLAVVGGNDLLRNEWFYRHSNLAALPVSYPEPLPIFVAYAAAALAALVSAHVLLRRREPGVARPL